MNKPLYTISYTLATAGAAGLLFAGIYALVGPLRPEKTYNMLVSSIISETSLTVTAMDLSGGFVRVQKTYHSHGVDGEARPDDICPGGMQHLAHVHPWLLLEGP
jgi:hypothetical protein